MGQGMIQRPSRWVRTRAAARLPALAPPVPLEVMSSPTTELEFGQPELSQCTTGAAKKELSLRPKLLHTLHGHLGFLAEAARRTQGPQNQQPENLQVSIRS